MTVDEIPLDIRGKDFFHHIDMGFLNRRLAMTALPAPLREEYRQRARSGDDHLTVLGNDHLLVTMLLDSCEWAQVPTLLEALNEGVPRRLFRSTERLTPCPEIYEADRVEHLVELNIDFGKPVKIAYHTRHLVSSTGTMTLALGSGDGYVELIVGILHDRSSHFEIEPIVIGAPWWDHQRNGDASRTLMWHGQDFGEILPEDIVEFSRMSEVAAESASEWMDAMCKLPEAKVKAAFASLLNEPTKKDWGGESNDHFSSNVTVDGSRRTAAFLLKGPTDFREMTLDMCGRRADQVYRLVGSNADVSVVQHSHLVGEAVRQVLRALTVYPGGRTRKYCVIDGQATYRILKAYSLI